jgi:hypothetical protein
MLRELEVANNVEMITISVLYDILQSCNDPEINLLQVQLYPSLQFHSGLDDRVPQNH